MVMRILFCGLLATLAIVPVSPACAQSRQPRTEIRTGTVKEVRQKGRTHTLIISGETDDLSFTITPRVTVEVKLTGGDHTLLQKGAFLNGTGIFTNSRLFLDGGSVRLPAPGMKITESKVEKPEMLEPGQSLNARLVSGLIISRATSREYPDYEELYLKPAADLPQIMFQKDLSLHVISGEIEDAQPGQPAELEVIPGRNDKLTLVRVTIEGGEYTPPENGKKKR